MLTNREVIGVFPIHGQFAAIGKLVSRCMVYKAYIFINNNLSSYKNCKHNKIKGVLVLKDIFSETSHVRVFT